MIALQLVFVRPMNLVLCLRLQHILTSSRFEKIAICQNQVAVNKKTVNGSSLSSYSVAVSISMWIHHEDIILPHPLRKSYHRESGVLKSRSGRRLLYFFLGMHLVHGNLDHLFNNTNNLNMSCTRVMYTDKYIWLNKPSE